MTRTQNVTELTRKGLAVEPAAVCQIRKHEPRLDITIEGEPHAVPRWLSAVRGALDGELVVLP